MAWIICSSPHPKLLATLIPDHPTWIQNAAFYHKKWLQSEMYPQKSSVIEYLRASCVGGFCGVLSAPLAKNHHPLYVVITILLFMSHCYDSCFIYSYIKGQDSSVGIAPRYGLDGRIPVGARFSGPIQTGFGGPSSLLYTGCPVFPRVKAAGAWHWAPILI